MSTGNETSDEPLKTMYRTIAKVFEVETTEEGYDNFAEAVRYHHQGPNMQRIHIRKLTLHCLGTYNLFSLDNESLIAFFLSS